MRLHIWRPAESGYMCPPLRDVDETFRRLSAVRVIQQRMIALVIYRIDSPAGD
jgi:hypothetical protein